MSGSLGWFVSGMMFWIVFNAMLRSEGSLSRIGYPLRAWWHKVTWDEQLDQSNGYGDILVNLLGTMAVIFITCAAIFGITFTGKHWIRFMTGE